MISEALLIALLAVGVPALTTLSSLFVDRLKRKADVTGQLTTSAMGVMEVWKQRATYLESRLDELEAELLAKEKELKEHRTLKYGARRLANQVMSLGHKPVYTPPETGPLTEPK